MPWSHVQNQWILWLLHVYLQDDIEMMLLFPEVCHSLWKLGLTAILVCLAVTSTDAALEYKSKSLLKSVANVAIKQRWQHSSVFSVHGSENYSYNLQYTVLWLSIVMFFKFWIMVIAILSQLWFALASHIFPNSIDDSTTVFTRYTVFNSLYYCISGYIALNFHVVCFGILWISRFSVSVVVPLNMQPSMMHPVVALIHCMQLLYTSISCTSSHQLYCAMHTVSTAQTVLQISVFSLSHVIKFICLKLVFLWNHPTITYMFLKICSFQKGHLSKGQVSGYPGHSPWMRTTCSSTAEWHVTCGTFVVVLQHAVPFRQHVMAVTACTTWTASHTAVLVVVEAFSSQRWFVRVLWSWRTCERPRTAPSPIRSSATITTDVQASTLLRVFRRSLLLSCWLCCVWCNW